MKLLKFGSFTVLKQNLNIKRPNCVLDLQVY